MAADQAGEAGPQALARIYGPRRCQRRLEPHEVRSLVSLLALSGPRQ